MSENKETRSYGQGAQGEPEAPKAQKISIGKRFRYNFDNSLSRPGSFAGYVFGALILLTIVDYHRGNSNNHRFRCKRNWSSNYKTQVWKISSN